MKKHLDLKFDVTKIRQIGEFLNFKKPNSLFEVRKAKEVALDITEALNIPGLPLAFKVVDYINKKSLEANGKFVQTTLDSFQYYKYKKKARKN